MWRNLKESILNLIFPKFCFCCQREGSYLCQDCQAMLEISGFHQNFQADCLKDLYFAANYQSSLIKNLIQKFKYEPFVKELAKTLSVLIITHFKLLDNKPDFSEFILVPVPLSKKKLRWRGFNQAEEIGKELSKFFRIPLIANCLIKTRETLPQVELSDEERKENIKNVFFCEKPELIQRKKILLLDDVYTTGSTMIECAGVLKRARAKEIIGISVARG